ncbi:MAG: hypothetical protein Crog4KO_01760 [Crocinitomicaceae bacterium]
MGALALTCNLLAQDSQPYIEVAVEESIELKLKTLEINIFVRSFYNQVEEAKENMYYEDYYDYEEDYFYEMLLEESPKEVTKEMKKDYEERQKKREEREKKMEAFEENFVAYTVKDLMEELDNEGITYKLLLDFDGGNEGDYYDYEYYYDDYRSDSVIQVTLHNEDEFQKLKSFTEENEGTVERNGDYEMESIEGKYEELLPVLAKKAKAQGTLIANALGQELGGLLSCSNIHPSMEYTSIGSAEDIMDYEMEYYFYEDPFGEGTEFTVNLVFRFKVN